MAQLSTKIKEYAKANGVADVNFLEDVLLQDDGSGAYIKLWDVDGLNKPNDVQLDAYEDKANFNVAINNLRKERNNLLVQTDWYILPDVPLTPAEKSTMMSYRATLRNITEGLQTAEDVEAVALPGIPVL